MFDLIVYLCRKLFEFTAMLIMVVGFYNYFTTPGNISCRLIGAYEKTTEQGRRVLQTGQDALSGTEQEVTRELGGGLLEMKKNRERGMDLDSQALNGQSGERHGKNLLGQKKN